jgi:hypothetical protein
LGEAGVALGCLGIGHPGQLFLHRSDARERRLAVGALLAQLAGELAQLALELFASRVRVLDVLLADRVRNVLDALGDPFRRLPRRAALGDHVVLRVGPRDEEQRHRKSKADDGQRSARPAAAGTARRRSTAFRRARASSS